MQYQVLFNKLHSLQGVSCRSQLKRAKERKLSVTNAPMTPLCVPIISMVHIENPYENPYGNPYGNPYENPYDPSVCAHNSPMVHMENGGGSMIVISAALPNSFIF